MSLPQVLEALPQLENPSEPKQPVTIQAGNCDTGGRQGVGFILGMWLGRVGLMGEGWDERTEIHKGGTFLRTSLFPLFPASPSPSSPFLEVGGDGVTSQNHSAEPRSQGPQSLLQSLGIVALN